MLNDSVLTHIQQEDQEYMTKTLANGHPDPKVLIAAFLTETPTAPVFLGEQPSQDGS